MLRLLAALVTGLSIRLTFLSFAIAIALPIPLFAQSKAAGGSAFTLVVKSDGTLWAFGTNSDGQLGDNTINSRKTPYQIAGLSNIASVAAGGGHVLALTTSGAVYSWGDNSHGQVGNNSLTDQKTPLLLSLSNVVAIAAGEFHSVALTSSGAVYTWGENGFGELGNGVNTTDTKVPGSVMTGVSAIAAGRAFTLVVKTDNTVWGWGRNNVGQLGNGTTTTGATISPVQMTGVSGAAAVYGGELTSIIRLSDGTLKAAGENGAGQLGVSYPTDQSTAVAISGLSGITAVAMGFNHTLALKSDGTVYAWGDNANGKLGINSITDAHTPTQITSLSSIQSVGSGANHSIAVDNSGLVTTWGLNTGNQLGDGTALERWVPVALSDPGFVWRVGTPILSFGTNTYNNNFTVTMTSDTGGAVVTYTQDGSEPTALGSTGPLLVDHTQTVKAKAFKEGAPASVTTIATYTMVVATPTTAPVQGTYTTAQTVSFLSTTSGATFYYTTDGVTDPTEAPELLYSGPLNVAHTTKFRIRAFKAGYTQSAVKASNITMNFDTLTAPTIETAAGAYTGSVSVVMSSPQTFASIRYTTNNTVPSFSSSEYLGPVPVSTTATIRAKAFHLDYTASAEAAFKTYTITTHTPILDTAAGSYAPGSTVTITAGQPATDTLRMTIDGSDPTTTSLTIASGTTIFLGNFTLKVKAWRNGAIDSAIASATYTLDAPVGPGSVTGGGTHSVIATPDGRVFVWGNNLSAQLGLGTCCTDRATPQLLHSITGVTAVAGGLSHTLARTFDGKVYAWGSNANGRLGTGNTTASNKPIHVSTLSNIVAIAAGDSHSLALTSDGHVFGWGDNSARQLGLGHSTEQWLPIEIPGLSNIVAIGAGDANSFAVSDTGQLYGWGFNGSVRLSLPPAVTWQSTPALLDLADVVAIAPGVSHTVAMTRNGDVYAWGASGSGQVGVFTGSVQQPTKIQGLHAVAITTGDSHSGAIRSDGALVAWGENFNGQIGNNSTQDVSVPVVLAGVTGVAAFGFGDAHSVAITPSGQVFTWGSAADGRLGNNTSTPDVRTPQLIYTVAGMWPTAPALITPVSGPYETAQTVTMTAADPSAVIHYTLDGSTPTEASAVYSASFEVTTTTTVKARAFVAGSAPSLVTTSVVTFVFGSLSAPTASPTGGISSSAQVTLTAEEGTTIRYSLDGLTPTPSSTAYSVPISITSGTVTLKAKAFKAGWVDSPTMIETYTIDNIPPTNVASLFPSPINGWNNTPVTITFHCTDNLGLAECPAPVTVANEGAGQEVLRSATDLAGNQLSAGASLSVDLTGPVVTVTSPSSGLVTTNESVTLTASVSDAISGVVSVTCNGLSATVSNGQVSCEVLLRNGVNSLVVTAQDAARNSGSAGVRVTRVGTATTLALAPSTGTKLIGDEFSMSLRDEFGVLVEAATWETSDPAVISLSTDDPPLLTAAGAGTATITATKDALSAAATVAVVAGDSLPDGTVKWSIENLGTAPISVNTLDSEGPATFTSSFDAGFWTVNALSADGRHLWTEAAPGQPVMADHAGALVAFTGSSTGLARFAGPEEALPWRHKVAGTLLTLPSQASDGTIYVIDNQPATSPRGSATTDGVVLAIDGNTGALKYRYPLPRSRFVYDSIFPDALANGCTQPPEEYGASYSAPVIGSDGRAYVTVAPHDVHVNRRWINNACVDAFVEYENRIKLIALSSSGAVTTLEVLNETNTACSQIAYPKQVLTDGGSGIVITTITNSECSTFEVFNVAYKTLVVNSAGAVASFASMAGYSIAMTSDTGTAYWSPSIFGNVVATDLATGTTKWTAPVAGVPLAPHADSGLTLRGNDGLVFLDGNGVITNTTSLAAQDAKQVQQGVYQGTTASGGIQSVISATIPIEPRSYFRWAYGNDRLSREAQRGCIDPPLLIDSPTDRLKGLAPNHDYKIKFDKSSGSLWASDDDQEPNSSARMAFTLWTTANVAPASRPPSGITFTKIDSGDEEITLRHRIDVDLGVGPTGAPIYGRAIAGIWPDTGLLKTNPKIVVIWDNNDVTEAVFYKKVGLHEIGHMLGLDHMNFHGAPSVMNNASEFRDFRGWVSQVVTVCDQDRAREAITRQWVP